MFMVAGGPQRPSPSVFQMNIAFPFKSLLLAGIVSLAAVSYARAHAAIEHAEPALGGTVKQSPAEVRLSFSEAVEAKFCRLAVFDASGKEVDNKDVHADPKNARQLSVSLLAALGAGEYKVVWRAVAVDTHVTKGEFTFRVKP